MNKRSQIEIMVIFIMIIMYSFITYNAKINHAKKNIFDIIQLSGLFVLLFGGRYLENVKKIPSKKAYGFSAIICLFNISIAGLIWDGKLTSSNGTKLFLTLIGIVFTFKSLFYNKNVK